MKESTRPARNNFWTIVRYGLGGLEALFRAVPPSLYLALGMTEKDEKAARRALMVEHGISELDAAKRIAQQLDIARGIATKEAA